jgi:hypothetical protein
VLRDFVVFRGKFALQRCEEALEFGLLGFLFGELLLCTFDHRGRGFADEGRVVETGFRTNGLPSVWPAPRRFFVRFLDRRQI